MTCLPGSGPSTAATGLPAKHGSVVHVELDSSRCPHDGLKVGVPIDGVDRARYAQATEAENPWQGMASDPTVPRSHWRPPVTRGGWAAE